MKIIKLQLYFFISIILSSCATKDVAFQNRFDYTTEYYDLIESQRKLVEENRKLKFKNQQLQKEKVRSLVELVKQADVDQNAINSAVAVEKAMKNYFSQLDKLEKNLKDAFSDRRKYHVFQDKNAVRLIVNDNVLFNKDGAYLLPEADQIMISLHQFMEKNPQEMKIINHRDNDLPLKSIRYADHWDLSFERTKNIALHLVHQGAIFSYEVEATGKVYRIVQENKENPYATFRSFTEFVFTPEVSNTPDFYLATK
ncbi:hypothetical protein [Flexithrix dorotheae]|uniref:hypothetical protein n=1 Tax=Flexithrix dorotheae TaxID=70993 RepID=UPI0003724341|nr:hypothetical protein [Flexithrix dorotheae]